MERLQKVIAASGIASRRQAELLITEGEVLVNGKKITELGTQVDPTKDRITVKGKPLAIAQEVSYLFYKPRGVITSTVRQDAAVKVVTDYFPKWPRVVPVGRLDKESEGLLVVTNQGDLAERLTHPKFEHEKEYLVMVKFEKTAKKLTITQIKDRLEKGVKLGDGKANAKMVQIKQLEPDHFRLYITVTEGRNHLIRRMVATLGLEVTKLKRIRIESLVIGGLKPGEYRLLKKAEYPK